MHFKPPQISLPGQKKKKFSSLVEINVTFKV